MLGENPQVSELCSEILIHTTTLGFCETFDRALSSPQQSTWTLWGKMRIINCFTVIYLATAMWHSRIATLFLLVAAYFSSMEDRKHTPWANQQSITRYTHATFIHKFTPGGKSPIKLMCMLCAHTRTHTHTHTLWKHCALRTRGYYYICHVGLNSTSQTHTHTHTHTHCGNTVLWGNVGIIIYVM